MSRTYNNGTVRRKDISKRTYRKSLKLDKPSVIKKGEEQKAEKVTSENDRKLDKKSKKDK